MNNVNEQITRWTLNAHPDRASRSHTRYAIHVVMRAPGFWAIEHLTDHYTRDGLWSPADDRQDWRPFRAAMAEARRLAPVVEVAGRTAEQSWVAEQSHKAVTS